MLTDSLFDPTEMEKEKKVVKEEIKMVNETKKIFSDPEMRITATTVRVPVYRSHSESVNVELEHDVELADIRKALSQFPGVVLQDDPSQQIYPMPLYTSGLNDVYVGRLRLQFLVCWGSNPQRGCTQHAPDCGNHGQE